MQQLSEVKKKATRVIIRDPEQSIPVLPSSFSYDAFPLISHLELVRVGLYCIHRSFRTYFARRRLRVLDLRGNALRGGGHTNARANSPKSLQLLDFHLEGNECYWQGSVPPPKPAPPRPRSVAAPVAAYEGPSYALLPAEVLSIVFSSLVYTDLSNVMFVCKRWLSSLMRFPPAAWSTLRADGNELDNSTFNIDTFLMATETDRFKRLNSIELVCLHRIGSRTFTQIPFLYPKLPVLRVRSLRNFDAGCLENVGNLRNLQYLQLDQVKVRLNNVGFYRVIFHRLSCLKELVMRSCNINNGVLDAALFLDGESVLPNLRLLDISTTHGSPGGKRKAFRSYVAPRWRPVINLECMKPRPSLEVLCITTDGNDMVSLFTLTPNVTVLYWDANREYTYQSESFYPLKRLRHAALAQPEVGLEFSDGEGTVRAEQVLTYSSRVDSCAFVDRVYR